ncbi:MAG TPA: DNA/RNA non-specific endonuclease, partial [Cellvibrio sp.]
MREYKKPVQLVQDSVRPKQLKAHTHFKDQRASYAAQLMQQTLINNSAATPVTNPLQLLATKGVVQAKTTINYGGLVPFTFQAGGMTQPATGQVGSMMAAELDPKDPRTGTDTSGSDAYNDLFRALQNNTKSTWVRGHLLNHDLGGVAHYNNLFPLTTAANGEHYQEVEKQVKHWVASNNNVHYEVNAYQFGTDGTGRFDCLAYPTSGKHKGDRIEKTIHSLPQRTNSTQQYQHKKNKAANKFSNVEIHGGNSVKRDTYKNEKYKTH